MNKYIFLGNFKFKKCLKGMKERKGKESFEICEWTVKYFFHKNFTFRIQEKIFSVENQIEIYLNIFSTTAIYSVQRKFFSILK